MNLDPLFLAPARADYRPATNSPIVGSGRDGGAMGANFPVGALMASSHPRFESIALDGDSIVLSFYADSEKTYAIQYSEKLDGGTWNNLTNVWFQPYPQLTRIRTDASLSANRFFRLTTPIPGHP